LRAAVGALSACAGLEDVLVLTEDEASTRTRLSGASVSVVRADLSDAMARLDRIRRLRAFSAGAWRGGVGALTWLDETLAAGPTFEALTARGLTAALVVDARREGLDAALCERVIARHAEDPDARALTFTQAAAGLCGMVVDQSLLTDIISAQKECSPFASIGGVLRYNPRRPTADPIGRQVCVAVTAEMRNALRPAHAAAPGHLVLELTTARSARGGLRDFWFDIERRTEMDAARAIATVQAFAEANPFGALTLAGRGDPVCHSAFARIVGAAREAGAYALHVRTDLGSDDSASWDALLRADVVSVDVLATSAETYEVVTGSDAFGAISERLQRLCAARTSVGGLAKPWIVPRLTRCGATLGDIEPFYDVWTALAGGAVIDPLPRRAPGERLAPLELPAVARARLGRAIMCVRADGAVVDGLTDWCAGAPVGCDATDLSAAWRALLEARGIGADA
jgi:hypothetical protein